MSHFLSQAEHDMSGYATDLGKSQTAYGVPRSQPSGVRRKWPVLGTHGRRESCAELTTDTARPSDHMRSRRRPCRVVDTRGAQGGQVELAERHAGGSATRPATESRFAWGQCQTARPGRTEPRPKSGLTPSCRLLLDGARRWCCLLMRA